MTTAVTQRVSRHCRPERDAPHRAHPRAQHSKYIHPVTEPVKHAANKYGKHAQRELPGATQVHSAERKAGYLHQRMPAVFDSCLLQASSELGSPRSFMYQATYSLSTILYNVSPANYQNISFSSHRCDKLPSTGKRTGGHYDSTAVPHLRRPNPPLPPPPPYP